MMSKDFSVSFDITGNTMYGDEELTKENLEHYLEKVMFQEGVFSSSDCHIDCIDVEEN